jgi:serine/threonine-protein kinase
MSERTPVYDEQPTTERELVPLGAVLLGKYRVDRVLGRGGMGVVLAATHLHLRERVAIKLLLPEFVGHRHIVERFVREAQAAARLRGEHVTRVIDVGFLDGGPPYIVMEHLEGRSLGAVLAERATLSPAETVDCILPVCEALAEAHARGIVHRDIKPDNVFLARRPDGSRLVKVLDFGISKLSAGGEGRLTHSAATMGTPAYMSPEQMRSARDVDRRTDVWALGVVLYECLAGRRPFAGDSYPALCLAVAAALPPPLPSWLPPGLSAVVQRLEKEPARRFAGMRELAQAVAPYAGDEVAARIAVERSRALAESQPAVFADEGSEVRPITTLSSSASVLAPRARRGRLGLVAAFSVSAVAAAVAVLATTDTFERGGARKAGLEERAPSASDDARDAGVGAPPDATEAIVVAGPDGGSGETVSIGARDATGGAASAARATEGARTTRRERGRATTAPATTSALTTTAPTTSPPAVDAGSGAGEQAAAPTGPPPPVETPVKATVDAGIGGLVPCRRERGELVKLCPP